MEEKYDDHVELKIGNLTYKVLLLCFYICLITEFLIQLTINEIEDKHQTVKSATKP